MALDMVARRGQLMQAAPAGAMLAVPLAPDVVRTELGGALEIAAVNAPDRCTVAGPADAIRRCRPNYGPAAWKRRGCRSLTPSIPVP